MMMPKKNQPIELSIIIGALNEEARIGATLGTLKDYLAKRNLLQSTEVVVVTADASDNTHDVVKEGIVQFPHHQHLMPGTKVGKGRDIAYGMMRAKGRLCLFMDADMATPEQYISIVQAMHREYPKSIIIGTRDLKKIHTGIRGIVSLLGNLTFKVGTGVYIRDTQCGFKAMERSIARKLFRNQEIFGWGFDMELLAKAKAAGLSIHELPIPDWREVAGGTMPANKLAVSFSTFKELFHVSKNYRLKRYDTQLQPELETDEAF